MKIDLLSMFVMVLSVLSVIFSEVEGEEKYNNQKLTAGAAKLVEALTWLTPPRATTTNSTSTTATTTTTTTTPTPIVDGKKDLNLICGDELDALWETVNASDAMLHVQCCNDGTNKTCVGADCSIACGTNITCIKPVNELGDLGHCESETHILVRLTGSYCKVIAPCPKSHNDPHLFCCKHSFYDDRDRCGKQCKCRGTCHYAKERAKSNNKCSPGNAACCECKGYNKMSQKKCQNSFPCPAANSTTKTTTNCSKVANNCKLCGEKNYWENCEKECNCDCTCKSFLTVNGCHKEFAACCDCDGRTNYATSCPQICNYTTAPIITPPPGFKEGECIEDNIFRVFTNNQDALEILTFSVAGSGE